MKAFYFSTLDKKLRYEDNRQIRTGRVHKVNGEIRLCQNGLHASKKLIDALTFAPGPYLWLVDLRGYVVVGSDKIVASEREYLHGFNATKLLLNFARQQALLNIKKIKPYCSTDNYDLIVRYLETGCEDIRSAAKSAAWSASEVARSAAWSAAEAAWSAAWSAEAVARSEEWSASEVARSAVWSAAKSAAWSASEAVARSAARPAEAVARSEEWLASEAAVTAEAAARSEAEDMLLKAVREHVGWEV